MISTTTVIVVSPICTNGRNNFITLDVFFKAKNNINNFALKAVQFCSVLPNNYVDDLLYKFDFCT